MASLARDREAEVCGLAAGELPLALVPELSAAVEEQDGGERRAAETKLIDRLLVERDGRLVALLREVKSAARVVGRVESHLSAGRESRRPTETTTRRLELTDAAHLLSGSTRRGSQ